uniref:Uncharacterized protein n=1 Tax=Arundo donax TaxID=35708 RepID=A0A0A9GA61_ARUDO
MPPHCWGNHSPSPPRRGCCMMEIASRGGLMLVYSLKTSSRRLRIIPTLMD